MVYRTYFLFHFGQSGKKYNFEKPFRKTIGEQCVSNQPNFKPDNIVWHTEHRWSKTDEGVGYGVYCMVFPS